MDKQELLGRIQQVLADQFEIDPARVTPEARLYDDLDIDSIDAVDLVVQLQALVGRRLSPDAFKAVRTVGDVVTALDDLMRA
ncbi:acyl carrier protein [Chitiniphilus shinanonensis]|uniref:acyl carrier protein n=1 Tax=Chitiniphilus shinanonensis TaxID=553088 RepID=UPI003024C8C3